MRLVIFIAISAIVVSCTSIPTGEVRKVEGKKWTQVEKNLGPVKVYTTWEQVPGKLEPAMKTIAAPVKLVNWILTPGFFVCLALTLLSQCPTVQKRALTGAIACAILAPVCWALILATSWILLLIPVIIGAAFVAYSVFRNRGLLFSLSESSEAGYGY